MKCLTDRQKSSLGNSTDSLLGDEGEIDEGDERKRPEKDVGPTGRRGGIHQPQERETDHANKLDSDTL